MGRPRKRQVVLAPHVKVQRVKSTCDSSIPLEKPVQLFWSLPEGWLYQRTASLVEIETTYPPFRKLLCFKKRVRFYYINRRNGVRLTCQ